MKAAFTVDVVIPTYRPDEKFHMLMRMLRRQTYPIHKIIVMNTGEVLPEEEHFRRHLRQEKAEYMPALEVYHLKKVNFDHGGTRNMGASFSSADICVFMTQDAVPEDSFLIERLVEPFAGIKRPMLAAVYARQLPNSECRLIERYSRSFNYPDKSRLKIKEDIPELGIKTFFCSNVCAAYRMSVFRQIGGFVSPTIFNEDMIYAGTAIKRGYAIYYAADACVVHSHNYSGWTQFKRNFDLAVSQVQHPEVFEGIKSESEGIRLVKETAAWLIKQGKPWLIPELVWQSGWKYLGYRLGRAYRKLPMPVIRFCSLQKDYWADGKD